MPITITVTDPTQNEARLLSDYFASIERLTLTDEPFAPDADAVRAAIIRKLAAGEPLPPVTEQEDEAFARIDTVPLPPVTDEEEEAFGRINTAAIFGGASVPPPPVAPTPSGVVTDSAGMPWDGRIHAATRTMVAGGVWRMRKGVDEALVASVTAELRAAMAAPAAPVAVERAETPLPQVVATIAPPPSPPVASFVAPIPGVTVPPPPAAGAMTFPQLMLRITSMTPGADTQARVTAAVQSVGLPSLPMLASRLDLVPAVAAALGVA